MTKQTKPFCLEDYFLNVVGIEDEVTIKPLVKQALAELVKRINLVNDWAVGYKDIEEIFGKSLMPKECSDDN